MGNLAKFFLVVTLFVETVANCLAADGEIIHIKHYMPAQVAYDKGFVKRLMRDEADAVKLWNRRLIEDDAAGAGISCKGPFLEPVYGNRMIKKVLTVREKRCNDAYVVFLRWAINQIK